METKKNILKKACGKGGVNFLDVAREIPGTLKNMGKNIRKGLDPANIVGKIGDRTVGYIKKAGEGREKSLRKDEEKYRTMADEIEFRNRKRKPSEEDIKFNERLNKYNKKNNINY